MSQVSRGSAHETAEMHSIVDSLKHAGAELDELWREAVNHGSEASLPLSEASQDIHRALIALTEVEPETAGV